jgi:hypothetical protein
LGDWRGQLRCDGGSGAAFLRAASATPWLRRCPSRANTTLPETVVSASSDGKVHFFQKYSGELMMAERYPWVVAFTFGLVHGLAAFWTFQRVDSFL